MAFLTWLQWVVSWGTFGLCAFVFTFIGGNLFGSTGAVIGFMLSIVVFAITWGWFEGLLHPAPSDGELRRRYQGR